MPRRREITKRRTLPDARFGSQIVTRFINTVMRRGKKSTAEGIVYGALYIIKTRIPNEDPLMIFNKAIDNAKPLLHVKARRVGGATYQVPVEIPPETRTSIAFRWIIDYSRKRGEKTMEDRLTAELMDCFSNQGTTIKKKD